jgi:uncharacterized protein YPO0396
MTSAEASARTATVLQRAARCTSSKAVNPACRAYSISEEVIVDEDRIKNLQALVALVDAENARLRQEAQHAISALVLSIKESAELRAEVRAFKAELADAIRVPE